jgi:hypothetical protein
MNAEPTLLEVALAIPKSRKQPIEDPTTATASRNCSSFGLSRELRRCGAKSRAHRQELGPLGACPHVAEVDAMAAGLTARALR